MTIYCLAAAIPTRKWSLIFVHCKCIYHLCLRLKFQQFPLSGLDLIVFNSMACVSQSLRVCCVYFFVHLKTSTLELIELIIVYGAANTYFYRTKTTTKNFSKSTENAHNRSIEVFFFRVQEVKYLKFIISRIIFGCVCVGMWVCSTEKSLFLLCCSAKLSTKCYRNVHWNEIKPAAVEMFHHNACQFRSDSLNGLCMCCNPNAHNHY